MSKYHIVDKIVNDLIARHARPPEAALVGKDIVDSLSYAACLGFDAAIEEVLKIVETYDWDGFLDQGRRTESLLNDIKSLREPT